jgi:aurora kinase
LSDFGWAVHTSKSRKTFCGTIDYIGPEIILRQAYNTNLDMWTIGVLAYELCSGVAPFAAETRAETQKKVRGL